MVIENCESGNRNQSKRNASFRILRLKWVCWKDFTKKFNWTLSYSSKTFDWDLEGINQTLTYGESGFWKKMLLFRSFCTLTSFDRNFWIFLLLYQFRTLNEFLMQGKRPMIFQWSLLVVVECFRLRLRWKDWASSFKRQVICNIRDFITKCAIWYSCKKGNTDRYVPIEVISMYKSFLWKQVQLFTSILEFVSSIKPFAFQYFFSGKQFFSTFERFVSLRRRKYKSGEKNPLSKQQ